MMFRHLFLCLSVLTLALGTPQNFLTKYFKVGIEYDRSLPMSGGSDRLRHRNNYDPFFVTITASAKNGYVISYIEVTATTARDGDVQFAVVRGKTGEKNLVFHLASNNSDFLTYSYLAYGIREEDYKKVNQASIPF
ncbi:uncharacterized protein LOC123698239 [Colias croceus]|uniref:uncharacterized protein LOC123698239 n=1 Tax=Colias crocea TaxID=72248 RepID=UPI001E27D92B|nr:uncharacterized protein LOC123698239 [Colias croceus]